MENDGEIASVRRNHLQKQMAVIPSNLTVSKKDECVDGFQGGLSDVELCSQLVHNHTKQVRFRSKQQSESALLKDNNTNAMLSVIQKTSSTSSLLSNPHLIERLRSEGSMDSLRCNHSFVGGHLRHKNSIQSDSSCYSSVESLLEARKPDPEAILINLGFGPVESEDILSRIPQRFLKPSQVRGIDTEAFIKRFQLASCIADQSVLGYRGLTGNPDLPPSQIVAKIMQCFEVYQRKQSINSLALKQR